MKLIRYSGRPVSLENLKAHEEEFKKRYDEISEMHGPDMLKIHESLIELDKELAQKWEVILEIDVPKSVKAWKKLIDLYEVPVLVAKSKDNPNELLLVLMDEL